MPASTGADPNRPASCDRVQVTAPAKINLFLHITGRRRDGFHLLESLFVFTRAGDVVTVNPSSELSFSITGPFAAALAEGGENLVVTAAKALAKAAGIAPNAAISLEKNLPVAAGIGGGSADAAATLLALNQLWQLDWSLERLASLALSLGADVPACLFGKTLYVQGVGENLTPVSLGFEAGILLVNPGRALSTPAVFGAYRLDQTAFDAPGVASDKPWQSLQKITQDTHNALQRAAVVACPEVEQVLDYLIAIPGVKLVRMSGSGATCFALFESREAAIAALAEGQKAKPEWWFMADTLAV